MKKNNKKTEADINHELKNYIPLTSEFLHTYVHLDDETNKNFDYEIRGLSAGQIFNLFENSILNIKWDVRESYDFESIVLARDHMFYTVDNDDLKHYFDFKSKNFNIDDNKTFKLEFESEKDNLNSPLEFFYRVNYVNINLLKNDSVYDYGTIEHYIIDAEERKEFKNNTQKYLYRNNCRKYSENFFAVSNFNLISHNITVNSKIANTVSEIYDEDKKNTISILGEGTDDQTIENVVDPEIIVSSVNHDKRNLRRNNEYLATKLINDLKYVYEGSIIIKYNPNLEIGDTITLIDQINDVFGIFEIDGVEHVLDQRGLLTNLLVKSYWKVVDPILDFHSTEISFKLLNQLTASNIVNISEKTKNKISKIIGYYLKFIVQSPKYCTVFHKKKASIFSHKTIANNNFLTPTALPVKFYPMVKKGIAQIPDNIKYAFFENPSECSHYYFLRFIIASMQDFMISFFKTFYQISKEVIIFVADILLSLATFDMHEFFKPLFGITSDKAIKKTYDELEKIDNTVSKSISTYNPYDDKYNLSGNFDLTIGFFNVRLQNVKDLFAQKYIPVTEENAVNLLSEKVRVVKKMLSDVFDCLCLVELYDGFNNGKDCGFKIKNNDGSDYSYKNFISDITMQSENEAINNFNCLCLEPVFSNVYGKEYGAVIAKKTKVSSSRFLYKTVELQEGRKAIEFIIDISALSVENNINRKAKIKLLKIIFLHNLYGDSQLEKGKNSLDIRIENVNILLRKYMQEALSDETGVVIMGDFNLHLYSGPNPIETSSSKKNYIYHIDDKYNFIATIEALTTLGQDGEVTGSQYDNILVSKNILNKIKVSTFEYPENDKIVVSDHIPVYIGIKKLYY